MDLKNQTQKRTIKFRGLRTDGKGWVYGGYFQHTPDEDGVRYYIFDFNEGAVEVIPESVGQFTGLHDKNGKEIYEGDILNVGENLVCEIVYVDKNVEYYGDEIHCAFHAKVYIHNKTIPLDSYLKNNCEIIGNIHEDSCLLE